MARAASNTSDTPEEQPQEAPASPATLAAQGDASLSAVPVVTPAAAVVAAEPAAEATDAASVVVRRYRAAGEAREIGVACIPHGFIVVEALADGTYRLAPDQEAPTFETVPAEGEA